MNPATTPKPRVALVFLCTLALAALSACSENATQTPDTVEIIDQSEVTPDADANDVPPELPEEQTELPEELEEEDLEELAELADQVEDQDLAELDETPDQPDQVNYKCGNGKLEPGEDCDDGNDSDLDFCLSTCRFSCGDGVVQAHEQCDTAITEGDGKCPTTCPAGTPCQPSTLVGNACLAQCVDSVITACRHADGCCPAGCHQVNDDDCDPVCDNGILEKNETCEPRTSCATSCTAPHACLDASLFGSASNCDAFCEFTAVTACISGDGCCPTACIGGTDTDCEFICGDSQLDAGESCDPPSSCPVTCDDNQACTEDLMTGDAAHCTLRCHHVPITTCVDGDGCCPSACLSANDNDCAPVCGNNVLEGDEGCDDGNLQDGDGCSASCELEKVAFRPYDIDLRDPHIFVNLSPLGCRDLTDNGLPFGLAPSINELIAQALTGDSSNSGYLDMSILLVMRPLDASPGFEGDIDIGGGGCTAPIQTTSCFPHPGVPFQRARYYNATPPRGICLEPLPGTTGAYSPQITQPAQPCFYTSESSLELDLNGILIPLNNAKLAASYLGDPVSTLRDGLIIGFISEADADATLLPDTLPGIGGQPLSSLLPGGASCCAPRDDRDVGPDGVTLGWWFYLNFAANRVDYTGP